MKRLYTQGHSQEFLCRGSVKPFAPRYKDKTTPGAVGGIH